MHTMQQNPDYKHEGSGAGQGAADFSFNLKGKTYWITVSEAQKNNTTLKDTTGLMYRSLILVIFN